MSRKSTKQKFKKLLKLDDMTRNCIKETLLILFLGLFMVLIPAYSMPQSKTGFEVKKVVIDAGHGGKDPGALGTRRYKNTESDIALDVALKLKEYILKNYDNVEVIMTRKTDVFLELYERTVIANKAKADLFISIHCNTNGNTRAFGSETYVIGQHKFETSLEVAKRENQVIFLEDNYEKNYEGFDPNSPESTIGLGLMQQKFLEQSIFFADLVQDQFRDRVKRKDRGVKQAGYWVISRTIMPSVLVELGFLSNKREEDFLNTENGRVYMASAIYRAFKNYKIQMEGVDTSLKGGAKKKKVVKKSTPVKKKDSKGVAKKSTAKKNSNLIFKVQIASSKTKIALKPANFKGVKNVEEYKTKGIYKYTVGNKKKFKEALALQREMRKNKYKDAFVVPFYKGKKISLKEAFEIMKKHS